LKQNPKWNRGWLHSVLLITGVAFIAYIISLFDFFQLLEYKLYDLNFQIRGTERIKDKNIVIVAIDQETTDSLSFPFNRIHFAHLIRKLNKLGA